MVYNLQSKTFKQKYNNNKKLADNVKYSIDILKNTKIEKNNLINIILLNFVLDKLEMR